MLNNDQSNASHYDNVNSSALYSAVINVIPLDTHYLLFRFSIYLIFIHLSKYVLQLIRGKKISIYCIKF